MIRSELVVVTHSPFIGKRKEIYKTKYGRRKKRSILSTSDIDTIAETCLWQAIQVQPFFFLSFANETIVRKCWHSSMKIHCDPIELAFSITNIHQILKCLSTKNTSTQFRIESKLVDFVVCPLRFVSLFGSRVFHQFRFYANENSRKIICILFHFKIAINSLNVETLPISLKSFTVATTKTQADLILLSLSIILTLVAYLLGCNGCW